MQQDEQSNGQHKGLRPQTGQVGSVTAEMSPPWGTGRAILCGDRPGRGGERPGEICGWCTKALCWKLFFPICSWEGGAVVKHKKQRDPLIHQWKQPRAKLAWLFGVPHGASLQLQWSQERCKKGNPFSWPYLGWNLPAVFHDVFSRLCTVIQSSLWQALFGPVYIKPSCCLGIFSH